MFCRRLQLLVAGPQRFAGQSVLYRSRSFGILSDALRRPRGRPSAAAGAAADSTTPPQPVPKKVRPSPKPAPKPAPEAAVRERMDPMEEARELRRTSRAALRQSVRQQTELARAGERVSFDQSPKLDSVPVTKAMAQEQFKAAQRRSALLRQIEDSTPDTLTDTASASAASNQEIELQTGPHRASTAVAAPAAEPDPFAPPRIRNQPFGIAEIIRGLRAVNVRDISVYDVSSHASYTDFIVVVTASNERQLESSSMQLVKMAKSAGSLLRGGLNNRSRISVEAGAQWTLVELGDVWIHFVTKTQRHSIGLDVKYAAYRVDPSRFNELKDYRPTATNPLVVRAESAIKTERQRELDERFDSEQDRKAKAADDEKTALEMAEAFRLARAEEAAAAAGTGSAGAGAGDGGSSFLDSVLRDVRPLGGTDRDPLPTATGPFAKPARPVLTDRQQKLRTKKVAYGTVGEAGKIGRGGERPKGPTDSDIAEREILQRRKKWVDSELAANSKANA